MLFNSSTYQRIYDEIFEVHALAYLVGLLALVFGLVILTVHHSWNADWTVIVTLIGLLALIKGSLLILCPSVVLRLSLPLMAQPVRMHVWATVSAVLGLFLGVKGYGLA